MMLGYVMQGLFTLDQKGLGQVIRCWVMLDDVRLGYMMLDEVRLTFTARWYAE